MRFALTDEQRGFASSLADLLAGADVVSAVRRWADDDTASGLALWKRLTDQGVAALVVPEDAGGLGGSPVDLVVAFEQLGRHAVPGPWVESAAYLPTLLADAQPDVVGALAEGAPGSVRVAPHAAHALDADVATHLYAVDDGTVSSAGVGEQSASVDPARRLFAVEVTQEVQVGAEVVEPRVRPGHPRAARRSCSGSVSTCWSRPSTTSSSARSSAGRSAPTRRSSTSWQTCGSRSTSPDRSSSAPPRRGSSPRVGAACPPRRWPRATPPTPRPGPRCSCTAPSATPRSTTSRCGCSSPCAGRRRGAPPRSTGAGSSRRSTRARRWLSCAGPRSSRSWPRCSASSSPGTRTRPPCALPARPRPATTRSSGRCSASRSAWPASAVPEKHGGAGFGFVELAIVLEELGRSLAPTPLLATALAAEALLASGDDEACARLLPDLAAGARTATLAWSGVTGMPDTAVRRDRARRSAHRVGRARPRRRHRRRGPGRRQP